MTVYIEYALLENFLYDYLLIRLAFFAARERTRALKVGFSALFGAGFALVCPFIHLPKAVFLSLKIGVGCLLCLFSFGRLKTRKEWGRYAFTVLCFFALTFSFGGALQSFGDGGMSPQAVFAAMVCLGACFLFLLQKIYEKRALHSFIYPCVLFFKGNSVQVFAYYDTGNRASKNGVPICFASPEILYELYGDEILKGGGTVCDETEISTVSGRRKTTLYEGMLTVMEKGKKSEKNRVYFAPSKNMISREYKVLLNAAIIGD